MRHLRIGCGVSLLLTAVLGLFAYAVAALGAALVGVEALEAAVLIGGAVFLLGSGGAVLLWSASDDRDHFGASGSSPRPFAWLIRFALVLVVGQAILAVAPRIAGITLPPLHFLAALLPAFGVTAALAWKPRLVGLTYGGCGAATAALIVEGAVGIVLGVAALSRLQATSQGRAVLEAAERALDTASTTGEIDPAALAELARSPVILLMAFGMIGVAGPLIEETIKAWGVLVVDPRGRAQAWWWGVALGAGFGVTEAVMLGSMGIAAWSLAMLVRAGATLMHATMTGFAGLGFYLAFTEKRRKRGALLFAAAAIGHMSWNTLAVFSAIGGLGALEGNAPAGAAALAGPGLATLLTIIAVGYLVVAVRYRAGGPWYTAAPHTLGGSSMTAIEYARSEQQNAQDRLVEFLRIPSISAVPEHAADVQAAAAWIAQRLREAGASETRVDPTPGHPVVYGEWTGAPGAPTVLVYGHYDVQPPDPLEEWVSPPFEPSIRDGAVYARGASDDKGQVLTHIEALAAYTGSSSGPPVNLKYVIEGEEEVGSPNLDRWLGEHSAELAADFAVISDTAMVAPDQPSIVYGLRGLAYLEVELKGPNRDLHSGQYGGAVLNPAHVLARIIARLHDADGRIAVPGFYEKVRPLGDEERQLLAAVPLDEKAWHEATGAVGDWGESGFSRVERLGARPTLDVNGIWAGWTGSGAKTVLPATAHAKISMRLVPDQDPHEITQQCSDYIRHLAPEGVSVTIEPLHGAPPAIVDRDSPAVLAAARGYETAFGKAPVFAREGGTIPVVASLQEILGLPAVLMGFGLPDDNLHAPNEKFDLANYWRGTEAVIHFLAALAQHAP